MIFISISSILVSAISFLIIRISNRKIRSNEIEKIIRERYNNYGGTVFKNMKSVNNTLRHNLGDKKFLQYLHRIEKENPKPVYKPTQTIPL